MRSIEFHLDRDMPEGVAVVSNGARSETIRVPQQTPPDWATEVRMSIEDYGKLIAAKAQAEGHR